MNRIIAYAMVVIFSNQIHAECEAPAGIYAACSSSSATNSNSSSDSYDSRLSTSLIIIGLGIGIGFGIVYFVSQAFKSETTLAQGFRHSNALVRNHVIIPPSIGIGRLTDANSPQLEWRVNLSTYRW